MKSSLVKKILFPACLMTFSAAVLAALAFSAYQGRQSRQSAQWALEQALESQDRSSTVRFIGQGSSTAYLA